MRRDADDLLIHGPTRALLAAAKAGNTRLVNVLAGGCDPTSPPSQPDARASDTSLI
jgi:hypothetical protein